MKISGDIVAVSVNNQLNEEPSGVAQQIFVIGKSEGKRADLMLLETYKELRRLAAYRLSLEAPNQTLQPTALVHEAYLRLTKNPEMHWEDKQHFFLIAAEAMRRILIENARRKKRQRHGGEWSRIEIDVSSLSISRDELVEVHEALELFEKVDPESAELVKLRFFVGLTQQQCADILGISKRTADKRWAYARAWLCRVILENRSG